MSRGIQITASATAALVGEDEAKPLSVGDYVTTSGLTLVLPGDIYANANFREDFCKKSENILDYDGKLIIRSPYGLWPVSCLPVPSYYDKRLSSGRPVTDIYTNPVSASDDGFFSVSPFFENSIPININACIYTDGKVRAFLPSYQLIGIKESTNRQLGYCGNDFGAIKQLGAQMVNAIEKIILQVGAWLAKKEYLGIFGADLLVTDGRIYLVEINLRFQSSTLLSSLLSPRVEDGDPYGEHLAAFMGLDAPDLPQLWERVKYVENASQLIAYNKLPRDVSLNFQVSEKLSDGYKGIPRQHVTVAPEGMIFKKIYHQSVTEDGYNLLPEVGEELKAVLTDLIR